MARRLLAILSTLAIGAFASQAWAAAEVHKLSLVLSAAPSEIKGGDFAEDLDYLNRNLENNGLKGLDHITYGWLFGAELRYLVRPSWALTLGVGQLKQQTKQEYLPGLQQQIQIREEILSVPIHAGAAYYFAPYNQGDFQARAFLGAGVTSLSQNRVTFQLFSTINQPLLTPRVRRWDGPGAGFYGEAGVHMFFASKFSVILSGMYRDSKSTNMIYTTDTLDPANINEPADNDYAGTRYRLDASGLGFRTGLAYGF